MLGNNVGAGILGAIIVAQGFFATAMAAQETPAIQASPVEAARPIPRTAIEQAILSDLAFNAPHLSIDLGAAKPSGAIENLVRARILHILGHTPNGGLVPHGRFVLELTDRGRRTALSMGWAFGRGVLQIPTGRLAYVHGSALLQERERGTSITYSWQYVTNENMRYLLSIGSPTSWPASMFPNCIRPDGSMVTDAQRRTIVIAPDGFGSWANVEAAVYPVQGCTIGR